MEVFRAQAQYDDWKGEVAADDADLAGIRKYVKANNAISDDETIVGVKFYTGEHDSISVTAYVADVSGHDNVPGMLNATPDPIPMREIEIKITAQEFLGMFKRFSVVLAPRGIDLVGREIQTDGN